MEYKFYGHDWTELAECWGITVEEQPIFMTMINGEKKEVGKRPETATIWMKINGTQMTFVTEQPEEILIHKLKRHMYDNIDHSVGGFINPQMRRDLDNFLQALYEQSLESDSSYPIYEAMMKIEDDYTLVQWVASSLERLWT